MFGGFESIGPTTTGATNRATHDDTSALVAARHRSFGNFVKPQECLAVGMRARGRLASYDEQCLPRARLDDHGGKHFGKHGCLVGIVRSRVQSALACHTLHARCRRRYRAIAAPRLVPCCFTQHRFADTAKRRAPGRSATA